MLGKIKDGVVKVVKKLNEDLIEMKESTKGLILIGISGAGLLVGINKLLRGRELEALDHAIELAKLKEKL